MKYSGTVKDQVVALIKIECPNHKEIKTLRRAIAYNLYDIVDRNIIYNDEKYDVSLSEYFSFNADETRRSTRLSFSIMLHDSYAQIIAGVFFSCNIGSVVAHIKMPGICDDGPWKICMLRTCSSGEDGTHFEFDHWKQRVYMIDDGTYERGQKLNTDGICC